MFFRLYEGRTPECHNRIADEFVNDPVVLLNCEGLQAKVPVEQRHHQQRSQPFRQACESDQVSERHGHIAPPATYCLRTALRKHVLQYSRVDVLAKGLLHALLRAQFFHEKIKGIGQSPHLISGTDR
ncbi:MAG: hypothetical protein Udaeo2_26770 [Candidatus Udaeobacter sp.]|nr:MAG: hypothetical protein Udaeo2_26770 [Candidatus Udaeobacter sp.]